MNSKAFAIITFSFLTLISAYFIVSNDMQITENSIEITQKVANAANGVNASGYWGTKYGTMKVTQKGGKIEGVLVKSTGFCPFKKGTKILSGTLLEDTIAGKFKMCQIDPDLCGPPVWAAAMLLVTKNNSVLSGSAHSKAATCSLVGFSKSSGEEKGLYFKKQKVKKKKKAKKAAAVAKAPKKPKKAIKKTEPAKEEPVKDDKPKTLAEAEAELPPLEVEEKEVIFDGPPVEAGFYDPRKAKLASNVEESHLRNGQFLMQAGRFEKARKEFKQVLHTDEGNPVALNGIGVTYYARNDYDNALKYYKKALGEDPNFSDAYYNMACVYALTKKPDMALRYLKISVMNGFQAWNYIEKDPDLESIRDRQEYKDLAAGVF